MYGEFILFEEADGQTQPVRRLPIGDTGGRDESWLRDTLAAVPEIIPIAEIDASYGPLVPLCRELRTDAGPVDLAFINPDGLLTLVECKLWRNPEARRKVVAQVLDYARSIARWTYADLQREVAKATHMPGNVPFALVQAKHPGLEEPAFVDAVARSMRSGRFLLLVAGDGIREDVGAIAELINRNAALGFSFGLIEVALFNFGTGLVIQPRTLARTLTIERTVVIVRDGEEAMAIGDDAETEPAIDPPSSARYAQMREWWQPLDGLNFDDPEQPAAKCVPPNNLYSPLPRRGTWISAYRAKSAKKSGGRECGVFLSGRVEPLRALVEALINEGVFDDLPPGTTRGKTSGLVISRPETDFETTQQEHEWLAKTMNTFVNAIRPRIKKFDRENLC